MKQINDPQSQDRTVFLSFTSFDRSIASAVVAGLRGAGVDVWWDEGGIGWGDDWQGKLEQALGRCGAYVILLGTGGVRRWVKPELGVALRRHVDNGLPILPLLLQGVLPEAMPPFLSLFQARSLPTELDTFDFGRLADELRSASAPTVPPVAHVCPFPGLLSFAEDAAPFFLLCVLSCLKRSASGSSATAPCVRIDVAERSHFGDWDVPKCITSTATLRPLDKAANAEGQRRRLDPEPSADKATPSPSDSSAP